MKKRRVRPQAPTDERQRRFVHGKCLGTKTRPFAMIIQARSVKRKWHNVRTTMKLKPSRATTALLQMTIATPNTKLEARAPARSRSMAVRSAIFELCTLNLLFTFSECEKKIDKDMDSQVRLILLYRCALTFLRHSYKGA